METKNLFKLYLGRNIKDIYKVEPLDIHVFCLKHISPVFPGFTRIDCKGYWKGASEYVTIIEIIADGGYDTQQKLSAIAQAYNTEFKQECIMLTYQPVNMMMIEPL